MRVVFARKYISVLVLGLILVLYLVTRDRIFAVQPVERAAPAVQTPTPAVQTPSYPIVVKKNLSDEVERLTYIVGRLPEHQPLPATLKYRFEMLPDGTPKDPIVPSTPLPDAEATFLKYIQSLQIKCPQKVRIGRNEDGGWDACVAGPFNVSSPCLVYSIGMGGEWSFDHMITDQYKCFDMAYDPTLGKQDHKPKELLWFYNTGLGISNMVNEQKWRVRTFEKLLEENAHLNKTIDILKMDIEYSEWSSLEAILKDGSLRNVKQLMVEFHTMEVNAGKSSSARDYSYYWQILRGLDKLGFKRWHYLATPTGHFKSKHSGADVPCCANVYFVNANLLV